MTEEAKVENKAAWTTWEELLLACAVKRHGFKDWDSVSMEIQTRTSLPLLLTPQICRNKYHELKRRFRDNNNEPGDDTEIDDCISIPWIEELRKLRVAELRQEVHRHDLSIQSLQLKVKRLEEEREQSLKENENDDENPDLEKDSKGKRSENDKNDRAGVPDNVAGKSVSGERSDRSFNESNSSESREKEGERLSAPVQTGAVKLDPESKTVGEDSCNDSSDTVAKYLASRTSQEKKDSDELRDSATESKEGTKDSSDMQSSASLTKKKRRRQVEMSSVGRGDEPVVVSPVTTIKQDVLVKSEPLVGILDIIRSHKAGSMFDRRLESQKTDKYKSIVRQHVDLRTVQTRIDDGSYSSCNAKLYLDLLLLFNNAIVFFPKSSAESVAAHELRHLVLKELRKNPVTQKPESSPEPAPDGTRPKLDQERPDSVLAKHKSTVPIVVCRKRSSISAKPSSSNKAEKEAEEEALVIPKPPLKSSSITPNEEERESSIKMKTKEKPVTGARSMRRSTNGRTTNSNTTINASNKNQITNSSSNLGSTSKGSDGVEKKKAEITTAVKKRGAADFLKRIKKNYPGKGAVVERMKRSSEDFNNGGGSSRKIEPQKKRLDERKDGTARQKNGGGIGKQMKEESSPWKRGVGRPPKKGRDEVPAKRGRESGEVERASKRSTKRTRR